MNRLILAIVIAPAACAATLEARTDYISLNREPLAWGQAYPTGEQPPYSVQTGFRFPAPVGPASFSVIYSGCDVENVRCTKTTVQHDIIFEQDRVSEVHFGGRISPSMRRATTLW